MNNKLHSIKPELRDWTSSYRSVRRDEVLLCRLRIGHTRLTHSFLFNDEDPPECDTCQCIITLLQNKQQTNINNTRAEAKIIDNISLALMKQFNLFTVARGMLTITHDQNIIYMYTSKYIYN